MLFLLYYVNILFFVMLCLKYIYLFIYYVFINIQLIYYLYFNIKGYFGEVCQHVQICVDNCNNRGVCRHGICFCLNGLMGVVCEIDSKKDLK